MSLTSTVVTTGVAFGVLTWDHIFLFPHELDIYRWKSSRPASSSSLLSFVLLRYSGLLALISSLLFVTMKTNRCEGLIIANQIGTLLTVASAGCIFLTTVMLKWERNKLMASVMGTLYIAMVACSCVAAVQFRPAINSGPSSGSGCQLQPLSSMAAIGYGASLIFDIAILISMLLRKTSSVPYAPDASSKNNVAYIAVATAANLFFLIIHALGSKLQNVKVAAQPFASVILVLIGVRLFMVQASSDSRRPSLPFYGQQNPGRPQSLNTLSVLNVGRQSPTILVTPPTATAGGEMYMKSYPATIPGGPQRPDTPFSSYDYYDSDSEDKPVKAKVAKDAKAAYITRETVVTVS